MGAVDQAGRGDGLQLDSQRVSFDGCTFAQRANSQSDMDGQFIVDVQYDAAFGNLHESSDLGGNGELLAKIATVLARLHATAAACGRLCRNGSIKWKIGYDRRALALQAAIAAVLFVASRFLPSGFNMNYAYQDPLFHRSCGPAPGHLAVIFVGAFALVYWPTHLLLSWMFPVAATAK
ncbi:MAG: hypothetical protein AUG46_00330 [Acidobacteria bacterium 13_1_20CM_3_58_11]|nr:MAG: hypothetical protein AUG46_00330 [Acidobacteria bacterium 13_1_20CM_3_58_11]